VDVTRRMEGASPPSRAADSHPLKPPVSPIAGSWSGEVIVRQSHALGPFWGFGTGERTSAGIQGSDRSEKFTSGGPCPVTENKRDAGQGAKRGKKHTTNVGAGHC